MIGVSDIPTTEPAAAFHIAQANQAAADAEAARQAAEALRAAAQNGGRS
ncbi:hypothetical protein ABT391_36760 [Streptomyces jumonjinensis]